MNIVVIGGHGLIGSKLVAKLEEHGHEAVAADLNSGVNTLTGEGLADALEGAEVVVDVTNRCRRSRAATARPICRSGRTASTSSSPRTSRRGRPHGWPQRSGR